MDKCLTEDIVTIRNCKTNEIRTFKLVKFKKETMPIWTYNTKNNAKRNYYTSKIVSDADGLTSVSVDTPIGKACYGKTINDIITCKTPNGVDRYIVIDINKNST